MASVIIERKPEWDVPTPAPIHRISAASLHAARVLLECYEMRLKPGCGISNLCAEERALATFLDLVTNIHHVASLRHHVRHWSRLEFLQHARQEEILRLLDDLASALDLLKPGWAYEIQQNGKTTRIPEFARDAARALLQFFEVLPRRTNGVENLRASERHLSITVETAMGARHLAALRGTPQECAQRMRANKIMREQVALYMRRVGFAFDYLPSYGEIRP